MKPPIFTIEGHDLIAFDSVEGAQRFVEWQDVDLGATYDSEGRLLEFSLDPAEAPRGSKPPQVRVRATEEVPSHQAELRRVLVDALGEVADDAELADLVELAFDRFYYQPVGGDLKAEISAAAAELLKRFQGDFETAGGQLQVRVTRASKQKLISLLLSANVTWSDARNYDHIDIDVAQRLRFSKEWRLVRSVEEAKKLVETEISQWLRQTRHGGEEPSQP
jgi:hypothetical protein